MELNSVPVIIGDFPKLKRHRRWYWFRCTPLVLLIAASKRLGLFGLCILTMVTSMFAGFLKSFDYYITSSQEWLEGPDKILELVIAYSIIFISLLVIFMAVVSAFLLGNIV